MSSDTATLDGTIQPGSAWGARVLTCESLCLTKRVRELISAVLLWLCSRYSTSSDRMVWASTTSVKRSAIHIVGSVE